MPGTNYWWYTAPNSQAYGDYNTYFHNGVRYMLFVYPPTKQFIIDHKLTYVGKGDINYIKRHVA